MSILKKIYWKEFIFALAALEEKVGLPPVLRIAVEKAIQEIYAYSDTSAFLTGTGPVGSLAAFAGNNSLVNSGVVIADVLTPDNFMVDTDGRFFLDASGSILWGA